MKKHTKKSFNGITIYIPVEKKKNRPAFPKPCIYKSAKKYDRNAQKRELRGMIF